MSDLTWAVVWYVVAQAFGLAALPVSTRLFRDLPDRGYGLSKALGLVLGGWLFWILNTKDKQDETVRLRIYDTHVGGWGHIDVDDITYTGAAPIPEPSALLLAALGLLGIAAFRRRR